MPGDSCISQVLSTVHEIQSSFDYNPLTDVRAKFLDISKDYDKVWHQGLLLKLKSYALEGNLSKLLESYLHKRKQTLVRGGQCSSWKIILPGVPQVSVLRPLLYLMSCQMVLILFVKYL